LTGFGIRAATPRDAPMLARLHVETWAETYRLILPRSEFAARPHEVRLAQWTGQIARGGSRIALASGLGFAQMGPQRDTAPEAKVYPDELYCLYVLARAHGTGLAQALLAFVRGAAPFTALVVEANERACAFYEKMGGRHLVTRSDRIGETAVTERLYGFGR
jgi:GNAT superfamily N-acetyltransferase